LVGKMKAGLEGGAGSIAKKKEVNGLTIKLRIKEEDTSAQVEMQNRELEILVWADFSQGGRVWGGKGRGLPHR